MICNNCGYTFLKNSDYVPNRYICYCSNCKLTLFVEETDSIEIFSAEFGIPAEAYRVKSTKKQMWILSSGKFSYAPPMLPKLIDNIVYTKEFIDRIKKIMIFL